MGITSLRGRKMKRKLFALPFVLILLIALAACSGGKDSSKQAGTSKSGTPKDGDVNDWC